MSIQVLCALGDSTRFVLGVGPFDPTWDPGPDGYAIYTLDDAQAAAVYQDTAYVCVDLATVRAAPC